MTFTEDDLDNLGYFKEQLAPDIGRVAAGKGELYDKYVMVCEEMGLQPSNDLSDLLVRCIQDDQLANEIAATDPEISEIVMNEKRKDDLEFILELREDLGIGGNGTNFDVEGLVEQRLEMMQNGPLGAIEDDVVQSGGSSDRVEELLLDMHDRIARIEEDVYESQRESDAGENISSPEEREDEIDGLFNREDGNEADEDGVEEAEDGFEEVDGDEEVAEGGEEDGFSEDPITPDDAIESDEDE